MANFSRSTWTVRHLLRRPRNGVGIIVIVGLGVAIATAMFSVLQSVVIRGLPYPSAERIVDIHATNPSIGASIAGVTRDEAVSLVDLEGFDHLAYYTNERPHTYIAQDGPRQFATRLVSEAYFSVFGAPPQAGRLLVEEDFLEQRSVAVLNHTAYVALGGSSDLIGERVTFEQRVGFEVVGVLPPSFSLTEEPLLYVPLTSAVLNAYATGRGFIALGRLSDGATDEFVDNVLKTLSASIEGEGGESGWMLEHAHLIDLILGDTKDILFLLFGISCAVVLIASSTASSIVSVRLQGLEQQIAVRRALGASDASLLTAVSLDLALLTLLSAAMGFGLAHLALNVLEPLSSGLLPNWVSIVLDGRVATFAMATAGMSMVLAGVVPSWRSIRVQPAALLRQGLPRNIGGGRTSSWLTALPTALSTIALICALAFAASAMQLAKVDPGYEVDGLSAVSLVRPGTFTEADRFLLDVMEQVRAVPGVDRVSAVLAGAPTSPGMLEATIEVPGRATLRTNIQFAAAGYHAFFGIPMERGRDIAEADISGSQKVVVVNETFSRVAFGGLNPIGQKLLLGDEEYEIVGVAADRRNSGLRSPTAPEGVFSIRQGGGPAVTVFADWAMDSANIAALHEAIRRVRPTQLITRSFALAQDLAAQTAGSRFFATATAWFAVLALILCGIGVNAIVAAMQRRRRAEIGLRMALGASPREAAGLIIRNAGARSLVGLGAGLCIAALLQPVLGNYLYGISASVFCALAALASIVVYGAAMTGAVWPALNAARTEPADVLRAD